MATISTDEGKRLTDLTTVDSLAETTLLLAILNNGISRTISLKSFRQSLLSSAESVDPENEIYSKQDVDDLMDNIGQNLSRLELSMSNVQNNVSQAITDMNNNFDQLSSSATERIDNQIAAYMDTINNRFNIMSGNIDDKLEEFDTIANTFAKRSSKVVKTLNFSEWVESESDSSISYTLSVDGVTANTNLDILLNSDANEDQSLQWMDLGLAYGTQTTNTIRLVGFGRVPDVNIPITIIIRGDA